MALTLDQLITECRAALRADPGPVGREQVRRLIATACADAAFVQAHLGPDNRSPRKILHEDAELGFCIIAHVYEAEKASRPHDHGPTWAIYGQACGTTEMTDWRIVSPPTGGRLGQVEAVRTYTLEPGDAHLYKEGEVHSPGRLEANRLIRVEGVNMNGVPRRWFDPR